jgi:hypothetical protein
MSRRSPTKIDKLHFLAPGDGSGGVDEYCFGLISRQ